MPRLASLRGLRATWMPAALLMNQLSAGACLS